MFSYEELAKKSVSELRKLLSDDTLLPLDETANAHIIERICDVITEKENVPSRIIKANTQKSWKKFKKKYIAPQPETQIDRIEYTKTAKPVKHTFAKAITVLAAAAIIILVVKNPAQTLQTPETAVTDMIETAETTTEATAAAETTSADEYYRSSYASSGGVKWYSSYNYEVVDDGSKIYNDKSQKTFKIYSSGEKIFFIAVLSNSSSNPAAPSENQLDPFDIFEGTYLENADNKKDEKLLKSWTINNRQIVIYDEEPGATAFTYKEGIIIYEHYYERTKT
jgi:hypothetical protein